MTTTHKKQREKSKKTRPAVVGHVLETLPDSLARREEVLGALAALIPPGDGHGLRVRMLQFHLDEHQKLRLDCLHSSGQV